MAKSCIKNTITMLKMIWAAKIKKQDKYFKILFYAQCRISKIQLAKKYLGKHYKNKD